MINTLIGALIGAVIIIFFLILVLISQLNDLSKYEERINKAMEIYENKTSIEYKKKRFMEEKNTSDLMYEVLKGEIKNEN